MKREHLYRLRDLIRQAAEFLPDSDALDGVEMFAPWQTDTSYATGARLRYNGKLYRVVQDHTSQADWTPDITPALYTDIAEPTEEWPEWRQPTGAHDAYGKDSKVSHNEHHWISNIDANVYEPGVYGWDLVE